MLLGSGKGRASKPTNDVDPPHTALSKPDLLDTSMQGWAFPQSFLSSALIRHEIVLLARIQILLQASVVCRMLLCFEQGACHLQGSYSSTNGINVT